MSEYYALFEPDEPEDRASELVEILKTHKDLYYNEPESSQSITDDEYDAYVEELRLLDPDNSELSIIGADPRTTGGWKTAKHRIPMASLDKVNTSAEMRAWLTKRTSAFYCVEEKMDGFSISARYIQGKLVQVLTRGGGIKGEDITRNAIKFRGLAERLPTNFNGILKGEVMFVAPEFKAYNEKAVLNGWHVYKNMRNGASGLARRHSGDGSEFLRVFFYDLASDTLTFDTHFDKMLFMRKRMGLWTPWFARVDPEGLETVYTEYNEAEREGLFYAIDGLVVKVDSLSVAADVEEVLGGKALANPKSQVAWKFADEARVTILKEIVGEFGVGGRITPVAILEPINLGGVTITRASAHNWSQVTKLGLTIGCKVLIKRANEVIPFIIKALDDTEVPVEPPTLCPKCSQVLATNDKFIMCQNASCPGVIAGNIQKWVKNLEVDYFGPTYIEALVADGSLKSIVDLYKLSPSDFTSAKLGDGIATRALLNLSDKKTVELFTVFGSLNIQGLGRSLAKKLVHAGFETVDGFLNASIADFAQVPGFGIVRATLFWKGLREHEENIRELEKLLTIQLPQKKGGRLAGESFCITGSLSQPKKAFRLAIEEAGGEWHATIKKTTTYLIAADPDGMGRKLQKARDLGISVIDEATLGEKLTK